MNITRELPEWSELFGDGDPALEMRLVRKRGEPLMLLPASVAGAASCLDLYPAQTAKARIARAILRALLHLPVLARVRLPFSEATPFATFLRSFAKDHFPQFGALLGNPRADGRRWIFLCLNRAGLPALVVKAGVSDKARALIAAEGDFLATLPAEFPGRPDLVGQLRDPQVHALACRYAPGSSPRQDRCESRLAALLGGWITSEQRIPLGDLPAWQRLADALAGEPIFIRIADKLNGLMVATTVMHGDLAPWNIREHRGAWTVLDWERGETLGIPGWDWFHFMLQHAVLVERRSPGALLFTVDTILGSAAFQDYAKRTSIAGHERALLLAYLLHCTSVLKVTEGSREIAALFKLLSDLWRND